MCGRGYADGIVETAMAAEAAHDEQAADGSDEEAGEIAPREAGGGEGGAGEDGAIAFRLADIDGAEGALDAVAAKAAGGRIGFERGVG